MKTLLSALFVLALVFVQPEAQAKRLGGGKSMGQQSSNVTQRDATPPAAPGAPTQNAAAPAKPATPAAAPQVAPKKPWGAMLGGLAAGLGLAWLAHSLGMGEGFGQFLLVLLVAVAAFAVIRMVMRGRKAPAVAGGAPLAFQGAGAPAASPQEASVPRDYSPAHVGNDASARPWERSSMAFEAQRQAGAGSVIGSALGGSQNWGVPEGFDVAGFTEAARRNFITLQAAWDKADVATLRSMMTDAMLDEIRSQLAEREAQGAGQPNQTDVVMLEAQLLGIEDVGNAYMASVEFSGLIREEPSAGPSPFREVWNMTKPKEGRSGWLVAGVQALQ